MTINLTEKVRGGKCEKGRYVDVIKDYKHYQVTAETEEDCFKKIYINYERPNRYCNDHYILLDDPIQHERYLNWKHHGVTIEMYYGSNVYD